MNLDPEPLFNKTIIEKLCSKIELTDLQKQSALEWIKKLENNELNNEQTNQHLYEVYILNQILGYEHIELPRENDEVDYTIDLPGFKKSICMEVKGTKTENLFKTQTKKDKTRENPVIQVYTYMSHGFDYGVVSNYNKFILITKNTQLVKAHRFNFLSIKDGPDNINEDKLKEFILLFSKKEVLVNNSIENAYNDSGIADQEFTENFYKLFHETRLMLIKEFEQTSSITREDAIEWAQKFLNRLIFIYFVEDRRFIPTNLFEKRIIGILDGSSIDESTQTIYENILGLFKIMNIGSPIQGVNGFNGGLFGDEFSSDIGFPDLRDHKFFDGCYQNSQLKLKSLTVDISISGNYGENLSPLIKNLLILGSHDFTDEVDVTILGKIFEQSISDLESLSNSADSARKISGVYYTPDEITKYICQNAIIPYLSKTGKNSIIELVDEYSNNLEELEIKIKNLKILDPACGSGAFLVKAVDILFKLDSEIQSRKNITPVSENMDEHLKIKQINRIIENNIYGVDVNPKSVDITKLSLFLKLAGTDSKLGYLSNNIKSGNSLVDDKEISQSAFLWEQEFPQIFNPSIKNTGFDIILANPPYVRMEKFKEIKSHLKKYETHSARADLYVYFYEKAHSLLKEGGIFGVISSNTFLKTDYGKSLRSFIQNKTEIQKLLDLGETQFFDGATTYPVILFYKKVELVKQNHLIHSFSALQIDPKNFIEEISSNWDVVSQNDLDSTTWIFENEDTMKIIKKIQKNSISLIEFCGSPLMGIKTGLNDAFIINENTKNTLIQKNSKNIQIIKPFYKGTNLERWNTPKPDKYLIYLNDDHQIEDFPELKKHLEPFKEKLQNRAGPQEWWQLQQPQKGYVPLIESKKIMYPDISNRPRFSLDNAQNYFSNSCYFIPSDDKFLLCLLNSDLCKWYIFIVSRGMRGGYVSFMNVYVEKIPIKKPDIEQMKQITILSSDIIECKNYFNEIKYNFLDLLLTSNLEKISNKLNNFWLLSFTEFIIELKKHSSKKNINLDEWRDSFEKSKKQLLEFLNQNSQIEEKINHVIYDIYNISIDDQKIIKAKLSYVKQST